MKPLIFLTVLIASLFILQSMDNDPRPPRRFLELEGKVYMTGMDAKGTEKFMDSASIYIYNESNQHTDTLYSVNSGQYDFKLALNEKYLITVSKKGFVSKKLHADTHVPLFAQRKNEMEFEMDLYKSIPGLDVSILDAPVAEIKYNTKKNSFDYDRNYTDQVNRELKKMYTVYYTKGTTTMVVKKPRSSPVVVNKGAGKHAKTKSIRIR